MLDEYDDVIWEMDYGNDENELRMAVERYISKNFAQDGDRYALVTVRDDEYRCQRFDDMWEAINTGIRTFQEHQSTDYWNEIYVTRTNRYGGEVGNILWTPMYGKERIG